MLMMQKHNFNFISRSVLTFLKWSSR